MQQTLVIGDVHGHFDRLQALLTQEGIIGPCPDCEATGDMGEDFCPRCNGDAVCRIDFQTKVIQLGDLGHFGSQYVAGKGMMPNPTGGDLLCYKYARDWLDLVLWGNHDLAVFNPAHQFNGYLAPPPETKHFMSSLLYENRLQVAAYEHGLLLTHAGVHAQFRYQKVAPELKADPQAFANWLNESQKRNSDDLQFVAVRDAIGKKRSGPSPYGGLLWRDASEKLYANFRQIFGHSVGKKVRRYPHTKYGTSYCLDVGTATNGYLAGIWLPDERVVEVKLSSLRK